jgi:signal transduction histidine kinase
MATTPAGDRKPVRVLLIDDDEEDFLLTKDLFADLPGEGYRLEWVNTYEAGLLAVCAGEYDVYLLDYRLGARTGLELLREARADGCAAPVILLTGQGEYEIDRAAMQAGAADYLEKGRLDGTVLERVIRYAVLQKRSEVELEQKVHERTRELEQLNANLQAEVAERRRAEKALVEADHRKDEFLATLAHELRNPLAPIRNALEIMRLAEGDPEAFNRSRAVMERQVGQMIRLIDDLLDVSRITRGKLQLVTETVDLKAVVEAAVEMSRPQIEKAGHQLSVSLPTTPLWVTGDRVRLAQVLSNLLNNAAKYTESGGSVLLEAGQSDARVVVRVRDTGIGIPPDMLPGLFDLFTQVNRSLNRSQGGLGIGLALVRRLVEMHGGTVEAHSAGLGQGAEFVVRLPAQSA